ncbi:MAG: cohesin domain-containing protein, partial [Acutalibacteraceae bacterium]
MNKLKNGKRFFAVLLALALVIGTVSVCFFVSAADDNYVKVADVEANPGETVQVPVTITNNTGFAFIKLMFSYDPEVFEPV